MNQNSVWNGTAQESLELTAAVERNCACEHSEDGGRIATCAPHRMMLDDQRAMNGLLFVRQIANRLHMEEFLAVGQLGPRSSGS